MLQAAHAAKTGRVILVSSADLYGTVTPDDQQITESHPVQPRSPYGASKQAAEALGMQYHRAFDLGVIIARPFNHIGAGQTETFAIASFAAQLARMEAGLVPPVLKVGNLSAARDIMDVRDVAATYVELLKRRDQLPARSIINVARGEATTIESLLEKLRAMATVDVKVEIDPTRLRPNEIAVATAGTDRIAALMPWPPQRSIDETLREVLEDKRRMVRKAAAHAG